MEKRISFDFTPEDLIQMFGEVVRKELANFKESLKPEYYTRADICRDFHVTLTTVNRWSAMGVLNPVKMGHRVYYLREDVEKAAMEHGLLKKAKRRAKNED